MSDRENIVKFPDAAAIDAEAAAWVARFDGGSVSAEEQAKFQEWLSRSSLHRDAIAEFGGLWSSFDQLGAMTGQNAPDEKKGLYGAFLGRGGWRSRLVPASTFGALAAVLLVGIFIHNYNRAPKPIVVSYETAVGAQRNISLPDGSAVELNTNTRIEVEISKERRDVRLVRGEAYFDVAHEAERPFTVFAGAGIVRDIGTAFSVHLNSRFVNVSVTKGSVELAANPSGEVAAVSSTKLGVVRAGQVVSFDKQRVVRSEVLSDADMNRKLAWRQGVLIYAGEPLSVLLNDLTRYSGIKIELVDPELANRPVGGVFKVTQISAVFKALETNFGVRADWMDSKHVRLFASHPNSPVVTKAYAR